MAQWYERRNRLCCLSTNNVALDSGYNEQRRESLHSSSLPGRARERDSDRTGQSSKRAHGATLRFGDDRRYKWRDWWVPSSSFCLFVYLTYLFSPTEPIPATSNSTQQFPALGDLGGVLCICVLMLFWL